MNIFISNDDGIDFEGLRSLVKAFSRLGDVYVVAPEGQRSSTSHHLTCFGKVRFEERKVEGATKAYALWGTPADCAYLGLDLLFKDKIDLVVSGINDGLNVSTDIVYSGTIAVAREAYIHHVPAMAVSLEGTKKGSYDMAGELAAEIAKKFINDEKNKEYFLNVNIPDIYKEDIKGIKVCDDVGTIHYDNSLSIINENGIDYVKINDVVVTVDAKDDLNVDITAINNGYIAVSPLYNSHIYKEYIDHVEDILNK